MITYNNATLFAHFAVIVCRQYSTLRVLIIPLFTNNPSEAASAQKYTGLTYYNGEDSSAVLERSLNSTAHVGK